MIIGYFLLSVNCRLLFPGGVVVGLCEVKHLAGLRGGVSGVSGIVVSQKLLSGVDPVNDALGEYAGGAGGGGCKE